MPHPIVGVEWVSIGFADFNGAVKVRVQVVDHVCEGCWEPVHVEEVFDPGVVEAVEEFIIVDGEKDGAQLFYDGLL